MFDFDFSKLQEETKEAKEISERRHDEILCALDKIGNEIEKLNNILKVVL